MMSKQISDAEDMARKHLSRIVNKVLTVLSEDYDSCIPILESAGIVHRCIITLSDSKEELEDIRYENPHNKALEATKYLTNYIDENTNAFEAIRWDLTNSMYNGLQEVTGKDLDLESNPEEIKNSCYTLSSHILLDFIRQYKEQDESTKDNK